LRLAGLDPWNLDHPEHPFQHLNGRWQEFPAEVAGVMAFAEDINGAWQENADIATAETASLFAA
jgi:hypothetical protein